MKTKLRNVIFMVAGLLIVLTLSGALSQPIPTPDDTLMTRTGKCEINPEEPLPIWGYSSYHDRVSEGEFDPLFASALVILAAGKKIAIVSLGLGRVPQEKILTEIRNRIRKGK